MYEQIFSWLVEHGMRRKQYNLIKAVTASCPGSLDKVFYPHRDQHLLSETIQGIIREGPIPSLTNANFTFTLLQSIIRTLTVLKSKTSSLTSRNIRRCILGLKYINVIAFLIESDKFDEKDVRERLACDFPADGYGPDSNEIKTFISISPEEVTEEDRLKLSKASAKYRKKILQKIETKANRKVLRESVRKMYEEILPDLHAFIDEIEESTKVIPTVLESLKPGAVRWVDYVRTKTQDLDEENLISFLYELINLRKESEFWLSPIHAVH